MKTIYNTYVVMESQEQCDRMKQICIDNNLNIWNCTAGWTYIYFCKYVFSHHFIDNDFFCFDINSDVNISKTQVSEQEFIKLLTQSSE